MDYKEAYDELFETVQNSDSPALKLKAMHAKEQLEKQQEDQQNQQQPEPPARSEVLAKKANERDNKTPKMWTVRGTTTWEK